GRALDPARYFIVATEMFGSGGSSSPSNTPAPFDGPRFPRVAIRDDVEASRRVLRDGLGVRHVRAVIGFSMGAQQAFQWAASHPDEVDGDVEKALRSITMPVLYMPGATDLYFPVSDAQYERGFLPHVTFTPIPSLWGHTAGGGGNPADAAFINREIAKFLGG